MLSHNARRQSLARPLPVLHVPQQPSTTTPPTLPTDSSSSSTSSSQPIPPFRVDTIKTAALTAQAAPHLGPAVTPTQELLTEHLGFPPMQYVDDVINAVNDNAYRGIAACEKFVLDVIKLDEEEAEKGLAATETLFENNIDKQFDRFELYFFQNILKIPENLPLTLPHHETTDAAVTTEEEAAVDAELTELRQRLRAAKYFQSVVRNQTQELRKQKPSLEKLKFETERLLTIAGDQAGEPLTQTFHQILQTLSETQTLRTQIHGQTSQLSFSKILNRKRKEHSTNGEEGLQSKIVKALEGRRRQVVVGMTPRKDRRSGVG
ncbi:hypothetical protein HK097_004471, partial [Rhizophlyctis rosea]